MINPFHIIKGWFASKVYAPLKAKILSRQRLQECTKCEFSMPSKVLRFFKRDTVREVEILVCRGCSRHLYCPVVEKSLVKEEKCPKNKWKA